ncbi:hypothetical protein [Sulfitobacter donghicola]|uniref:Lipoprotein n=1 Tax=Sulfitobacter donghicola DSW-25 = KCTC 12864 = JCM 14565 TaxID=1300350 RepID=A0A073IG51_9RHOB|nr:hypothetical protein [Sulfitobacter donghicola]KEJ88774.1 hypothetical protein DSW25_14090 [Sulfitobacter donghicola DSW-25 = KCTC 12864 = JCM 14565]KIN68563.1 putative, lipoprotein [Sulfitobacter donghicola DSW-25 = KCTC 12864 = JCM 14565]
MTKSFLALALTAALVAGCAEKGKESPIQEIEARAFAHHGQPKITLITMVNNRTGAGGHSALLVQGSQSVIFDPAGSFEHEKVPERGDVLYGMSPKWIQIYKSAHARSNFHVVSQEFSVTPAQAARAMQLVQSSGPVPSAFCANSISGLLRQVPGFETIRQGYYPLKLMEQAAELPGVSTTRYYEDDEGNVSDGIPKSAE